MAVVTGALGVLGRAIVSTLAERGMDVVAADLQAGSGAAEGDLATDAASGARLLYAPVDVRSEASVQSLARTVSERLGRLDVLVNNAGINRDGLVRRASRADWDEVIAVNLTGAFQCTATLAPLLVENGWGRIVNISSVVGLRGIAGTSYYAASKAGLLGLTRASAAELARFGITVNAVAPGYVASPMTEAIPDATRAKLLAAIPLGRTARPEEIARVVAFLVSEDASYVTGAVIEATGGFWA